MAYRTIAEPDAAEREEQRELAGLARQARARQRRAAAGVSGAIIVGSMAVLGIAPAMPPPRAELKCHHVQVVYENATATPGPGWTACEWRR